MSFLSASLGVLMGTMAILLPDYTHARRWPAFFRITMLIVGAVLIICGVAALVMLLFPVAPLPTFEG